MQFSEWQYNFPNPLYISVSGGANKFRDHSHCWAITCWLFSSARLSGIGWRQQVQMRWQPWGGQRYSWGAADKKVFKWELRREDLHFAITEHTVCCTLQTAIEWTLVITWGDIRRCWGLLPCGLCRPLLSCWFGWRRYRRWSRQTREPVAWTWSKQHLTDLPPVTRTLSAHH